MEAARAILSLHGRYAFPDAKGEHVRLVTVRPAVKSARHQRPFAGPAMGERGGMGYQGGPSAYMRGLADGRYESSGMYGGGGGGGGAYGGAAYGSAAFAGAYPGGAYGADAMGGGALYGGGGMPYGGGGGTYAGGTGSAAYGAGGAAEQWMHLLQPTAQLPPAMPELLRYAQQDAAPLALPGGQRGSAGLDPMYGSGPPLHQSGETLPDSGSHGQPARSRHQEQ